MSYNEEQYQRTRSYVVSFRPRKGEPQIAFEIITKWCLDNGLGLAEFLNTMFAPLAYYVQNHTHFNEKTGKISVTFNLGKIDFQRTTLHGIHEVNANTKNQFHYR